VAYDEKLAERIRGVLRDRSDITERRMMGGLMFLCRGRMCGGVIGPDLVARARRDAGDLEASLETDPLSSLTDDGGDSQLGSAMGLAIASSRR
jgi:hypothetical protein